MRIMIDIPDDEYKVIKRYADIAPNKTYPLAMSILNGKVLPDNATNGDVIKMMFPTMDISTNGKFGKEGTVFVHHKEHIIIFDLDWWNAPYREDGE